MGLPSSRVESAKGAHGNWLSEDIIIDEMLKDMLSIEIMKTSEMDMAELDFVVLIALRSLLK